MLACDSLAVFDFIPFLSLQNSTNLHLARKPLRQ